MSIGLKAIKPGKFEPKHFYKEMIKAAEKLSKDAEKQFKETTKGWKTKVKWHIEIRIRQSEIRTQVYTTNKIYGYVNDGTKAHIIRPKKKRALKWEGADGPIFSAHAHHPGFKGYHHDKRIAKDIQDKYPKWQTEAINKAAKLSGHSTR